MYAIRSKKMVGRMLIHEKCSEVGSMILAYGNAA
jgi:hypothetical protein